MKTKILVTAANGHIGFPAAKELLSLGFDVRALVRNPKNQSAVELKRLGAEIFVGDQDDIGDMRRALIGIKRVFYNAPMGRNPLFKTVAFIIAAEEAKIEHVVYLTQWLASENHPSIHTREQWLADEMVKLHKTVQYTFINPGLFAFMYFFTNDVVSQLGMLPTPVKGAASSNVGLNAPPSEEDQGRVAAHILKDPAKHAGKRYRPTGPELISIQDVAKIFGKILGKKVKVNEISKNMFLQSLKVLGVPDYDIANVHYYMDELGKNSFGYGKTVTTVVKDITGRDPENFETIARRAFANSPGMSPSFSNKLGAIKNLMKIMLAKTPNTEQIEKTGQYPRFMNGMKYVQDNPNWIEKHQELISLN